MCRPQETVTPSIGPEMSPLKVRSALPGARGAGVGVDAGDGEGLADPVGVGTGSGLGDGDGATVGDAGQGDALGGGEGDADGDGLGEAVGDGLADGSASGSTVGAAVMLGQGTALGPPGVGEAVPLLPGDGDGVAGAVVQSDVGDGSGEAVA